MPELATAVQYGINLVTVVFNNSSYGNVRRDQIQGFDGRVIGSDLVNPDFVRLAESFGVAGCQAGSPAELRRALEQALSSGAPALIEVPVERGSEASPWEFLTPKFG
jgi:acetolactate synthase-1/2/3 large subunit